MPRCGPKLSLCCFVLSVWGVLQLSIMGIFFYTNSVAFIDDIPLDEEKSDMSKLKEEMDKGYGQSAQNCVVAASLYLVTLFISAHQLWMNNRGASSM